MFCRVLRLEKVGKFWGGNKREVKVGLEKVREVKKIIILFLLLFHFLDLE